MNARVRLALIDPKAIDIQCAKLHGVIVRHYTNKKVKIKTLKNPLRHGDRPVRSCKVVSVIGGDLIEF